MLLKWQESSYRDIPQGGNGGGGNEGMEVEIVSEIRVRSLGLVNREGLGRITDVSNDSSQSSCGETDQENGVGWRWVES